MVIVHLPAVVAGMQQPRVTKIGVWASLDLRKLEQDPLALPVEFLGATAPEPDSARNIAWFGALGGEDKQLAGPGGIFDGAGRRQTRSFRVLGVERGQFRLPCFTAIVRHAHELTSPE